MSPLRRFLRTRTSHPISTLLARLTMGDTVVVTKLDRFARSTQDALNTMATLAERGVSLVVLNRLASSSSRCWPGLPNLRPIIAAAKALARGVYQGRPRTYTAHHKGLAHALELSGALDRNHLTVNGICAMTQVSRATLYRAACNGRG